MPFQVPFNYGSEGEKEFNEYHILTAVASRRAIKKVAENSSKFLSDSLCDRLQKLWAENLIRIGGIPNLQKVQNSFDMNLIRCSKILSQRLPDLQLRGHHVYPSGGVDIACNSDSCWSAWLSRCLVSWARVVVASAYWFSFCRGYFNCATN